MQEISIGKYNINDAKLAEKLLSLTIREDYLTKELELLKKTKKDLEDTS